ncbi:MAG TPA: NAD(P)/FAD-dependent oxidoreductase [Candidatus Binatia bacterium]|nr:NAD(P)/FAD-dependent oxidoreductase [Candidatus Binatia bacterium]
MRRRHRRGASIGLDAIVVGAGPNGLAAAIELARAGRRVRVYEAAPTPGGGLRSAELTLQGFVHDVCAAVHPFAAASPFFRSVDWARRGVVWLQPEAPFAHPLDDGTAVVAGPSVEATAARLGPDRRRWRRVFGPLAGDLERLLPALLGPLLRIPRHPLALARFGLPALLPATRFARAAFETPAARAAFAGLAAHSMLRLDRAASAAFGLVLGTLAQSVGWPIARGGSGTVAAALAEELATLGGELWTGQRVDGLDALPPARAVLLDVSPREALRIAGSRLRGWERGWLGRYRYGPGVFKIDWALDGPVPWAAPGVETAGTVHLGGRLEEIAAAEAAVAAGRHPERPFVILVQPSRLDPSRAPAGRHTAWAYCHVPNGSPVDMTRAIEAQVERFAPGFRDRILARHTIDAAGMERYDGNYVGGDIGCGLVDLRQLLVRPLPALDPYRLGPGLYLCSSATPPGPGVHGMCGWHAARSALRHELR